MSIHYKKARYKRCHWDQSSAPSLPVPSLPPLALVSFSSHIKLSIYPRSVYHVSFGITTGIVVIVTISFCELNCENRDHEAACATARVENCPLPRCRPYLPSLYPTVIVSIIFGTISLIWNDPWQSSTTRQRGEKVEPERLESAIQLPSASMFVERMLRYFFQTLLPAFRHLRQATASSLPGAARPRSQPALPLFRPPGFQEPHLVAPRPAIPRDTSSFRVPSNPYTVAEPASLQALPAPSRPVFLGPGWGSGP